MNDSVPAWVVLEQENWKNSMRLQEIFQWCGLVFSLLVVVVAPVIHQQVWDYALFMVPLNYVAVARSDYLIHRSAAKSKALEDFLCYVGSENMQKSGKSYIALFDVPAFATISVLGKLFSPYPLSDFSRISVIYWIACVLSAFLVWFATNRAGKHTLYYKNALEQYRAN